MFLQQEMDGTHRVYRVFAPMRVEPKPPLPNVVFLKCLLGVAQDESWFYVTVNVSDVVGPKSRKLLRCLLWGSKLAGTDSNLLVFL